MSLSRLLRKLQLFADEFVDMARSAARDERATPINDASITLEQRVMLSASPLPTPDVVAVDSETPMSLDSAATVRELIFVQGEELFTENTLEERGALIIRLDADRDGIDQISEALAEFQDIDALHLVTHGSAGTVQLGNTLLTTDTLGGYAGSIASWRGALSDHADILFYGCDLAATTAGEELMESIAELCDCDVAASDDITGHADLGGDWEFEYLVGSIETNVAFSQEVQDTWYGTLDITSNLLAHYEFDNDTLSIANDSTANSNTGVYDNGENLVAGTIGTQAADFTGDAAGDNNVITVADDPTLDFNGNFSVAFWYNSSTTQAGSTRIIGSHDGSDGFSIYASSDGSLNFFAQGSSSGITQTLTGGFINDGTWHHVVAVRSGDSLRLYVDDYTTGVAGTVFGTIDPAAPLTIGGENATISDYEGLLDDVRVYSRALSAGDVSELYATGTPRTSYSASNGGNNSFEHISNVTFAGINNSTGADAGGYGDYTAQSASVTTGSTNTLSVTISPDSLDYVTAWVDWNQDFDFNDAGEEFVVATNVGTPGPHTVNIVAPNDAVAGSTRMRVSLVYNQTPQSFGTFAYGEVEDYTINVQSTGPQTFTVTNTNDSGAGSLRQAIINANANAGADTIDFNIAGSGTQVINLASALDVITEQVTIDGTTQTGWTEGSFLPIVVDGNNNGTGLEFSANADGSVVRGLVIRDFNSDAVDILNGADNITIAGNFIGQFNSDGTDAGDGEANTFAGLRVYGNNVTIGGVATADRNVISGNEYGVLLRGGATNTVISGNYIGTDITGANTIGSTNDYGVYIYETASGSTIGGATSAHGNVFAGININSVGIYNEANDNVTIQNNVMGVSADGTTLLDYYGGIGSTIYITNGADNAQILDNLIAGARYAGIELDVVGASDGTVIQGNIIGTDATGTQSWGVGETGILIENATNTTIGGVGAGEGNVVAFSGRIDSIYGAGIAIQDGGNGNAIRGNSLYSNSAQGIDLSAGTAVDGVTANDLTPSVDADSGANNLQNWAILTSAAINDAGNFSYSLDLSTLATGTYTVDFYASTDRDGGRVEGQRYLFSQNVSGSGTWTGGFGGITANVGEYITLVTTDASGNSSEFSNYAVLTDSDSGGATPSDLQAVATSEGGLSINQDGGNDTYLIAEDGGALLGSLASLTYEIQYSTADTSSRTLVSYATASNDNEFKLVVQSNGNLLVQIGSQSQTITDFDFRTLADGAKHGVSFSWNSSGGTWILYVDGIQRASGSGLSDTHVLGTGGALVIGNEQDSVGGTFDPNPHMSATIYDARLFNDVRTLSEVSASFQSDVPYDEGGLVANWRFDQFSSDGVITDAVSGNNIAVEHISGIGFSASEAALTFSLDENAIDGTTVGSVTANDAEREALIASLLAADPDLRYNAETDKFYKGVSTTGLWSAAKTAAESTGLNGVNGQLVTIRSASENEFVRQIAANDVGFDVWIGATDSTVEGEWRWVEGGSEADQFWQGDETGFHTSGAYHNFQPGQPNDTGNNEDVARLDDATGEWLDADHDTHNFYGYIVEWNADDVLDATQAITYSIQSQSVAGAFEIDADTGEIRVADGTLLDSDTLATHTVTVRVADNATPTANTYDEAFTISLTNLVEDNNASTDLSGGIELNTAGGNDAVLIATDAEFLLGPDGLGVGGHTYEVRFADLTEIEPGGMATLYSHRNPGASQSYLAIHDDGTLDWAGLTSTGQYTQLLDGGLHSLAVTWDASSGQIAFFVDGEYVESTSVASQASSTGGTTFVLGQHVDYSTGNYDSAEAFKGTFHDFRVWDHARSEADISLNYQQKLVMTPTQAEDAGLLANWQFDGFNGSNEVVDIVTQGTASENNLSVGTATGTGFTSSTPVEDLHISENASDGASVGFVVPSDPDGPQDIVSDGLFLEGDNGTWQLYTAGQTVGGWTVGGGGVDHTSQYTSPLGGVGLELERGAGDPGGSITQTLTTEVGQQYQVVFHATGNFSGGDAVKYFRAAAGGESLSYTVTDTGVYEQYSFIFTADSTSSDLLFQGLRDTGFGAVISDVQVIETPQAVSTILNNDPTLSYDAATGKFYRHVNTTETWQDAQTAAIGSQLNGVSGQLVTVDSAYENQVVRTIAADGGSGAVWLGGSDQGTEGTFQWYEGTNAGETFWNGSAVSGQYSNFDSGEPNDWTGDGGQDFVSLNTTTGLWDDQGGPGTAPLATSTYMIEWDASQVLSNFTFNLTDDAGGRFAIDGSTGEITVADGSLVDYETATSHNVTVETTDAAGNTYSEVMAIAIDNIGPTQTVPIDQTINEDETIVFSTANGTAITVSDNTPTNSRIQVTLSVTNGTLRTTNFGGYSFVSGSNGNSTFTLEGTESAINAGLEGLIYTPTQDYNGSDSLVVTTALHADMEGYYTFEGGNADDQSASSAQNGVLVGGANTTVDAERGEVLNLDAAGEYVRVDNLYGNPATVTLTAWVNFSSLAVNGGEVISLGNDVALRINDGIQGVAGYFYDGTTHQFVGSGIDLAAGQWHHVAFSFDDTNNVQSLYIDGQLVGSGSFASSINWTGWFPQTTIGTHADLGDTSFDMQGMVDDARVYNRALSATEIAAIAADEFAVSDTVNITINAINDRPYFSDRTNAFDDEVDLNDVSSVTAADLDNDGDNDLIATTDTGGLYWFENDGTGAFGAGTLLASAQNFTAVEVHDLEGDGDMDIVAMNDDSADAANSVYVLTNNFIGSGSVSFATQNFEGAVGGESDGGQDLAIGDIDGDGRADIVGLFYRSIGDSQVVVFEQNSVGVWTKSYSDAVDNAQGIAIADMDGDLDLDLVVGDFQDKEIRLYENDGNATAGFTRQVIYAESDLFVFDLSVGDFNGDGDNDIAFVSWGTNDEVGILLNDGAVNPTFQHQTIDTSGSLLYHIDVADLDGDGNDDLLVADKNAFDVISYVNDGSANFTRRLVDDNTGQVEWTEAADIDGDGNLDIISASTSFHDIVIHKNKGAGYVVATVNEDVSFGGLNLQVADDAGASLMEVTVNVVNGRITLPTGSVTILSGGSGTNAITFEGTVADINTALNSFTFSPDTNFNGLAEIQVTADDRGNTGTGGPYTVSETLYVEVLPVNDTPVVTGPGSAYSFTEQGSLNIHGTGFSVADVDDNGGTMTATFSVGEGRVLIDAGDSGVVLTSGNFNSSGNSTDAVTFTGTKSQINALLSGTSTGTIVYYHDLTTGSDVPSTSTTITLTVNDQGNTGVDPGNTGDGSSEEHAASQVITITSVNDAPSLLGPNLISNGDFASDLTGWTTTGAVQWSFGRAIFGNSNVVGPHTLSQTFATNAGETYLLEFDYRDGHANLNQQLQVTVDGSANLLTTEQILTDTDGSTFVRYRFSFTADSSSATINFTDRSDDADSLSASTIGVNGVLDVVTVRQASGQLGTAAFTEDGSAVVLDGDVTLFDAEIDAALDDFDGTTLTLVRNGGANSDDVFSGSGNLVLNAGTLELSSTNMGSYTNTGGQLLITFNGTPTSAQINEVLQSIAYENTSDVPPANVQIDWTFHDNNDGSQGTGGALDATGYTVVTLATTNDDPTNAGSLPSDVAVTEDIISTVDLSAIDFIDVDAGSSDLTVTLSTATGGQLTLASDANIDFGGTATARTLTGTLAELNNYFNNSGNINYLHGTPHTFGDNADTITVVINDNGNTGTGGGTDQTLGVVNVDITAVNDEEVLATITGTTVAEGSSGTVITTAMLETTDVDNTAAQLVYTLDVVTSNGTLRLSGTALGLNDTFTQADIDAGNVTYDHDGSQTSTDSFDFTVDDGAGTTTSSSFNVTVTNVNDAPVVTVSGVDLNFTEQSPVGIDVTATISDVDDTNLEGAVIQIVGNYEVGFDELSFTNQNGISGAWDSGSGTLTLSGTATVANYQTAIQSIAFYNSSDQPSLLTRTVQWTVNDGDTDSVSVTRDIVMNAVNDTPSVSGPGSAYTINEQTNLNIHGTGFSVTDVDAASGTMTATFTAGEGTISLAAGDSGVNITSNNAGTVSFTGTLAQIDALLTGSSTGTIVYNNGSDTPAASTTITLTVNDGGNTGADPGLTADGTSEEDSASQTINFTAVNDEQILATNAGATVAEGSTGNTVTTAMLETTDVDNTNAQLVYTVDAVTSNGTLRLSGTALGLNDTFTQADIDAGNVTYDHDGSQTSTDSFDFTVDDGAGTTTSSTFNFTVNNVNDAPVNTVPGAQTVDEDTSINIAGISVSDDGNLSTVRLTVNNGTLDVTLSGTAFIFAGANGSSDLTLSGSLADINATLASLTYQGNLHFNGNDTLTVLSTDSNAATDSDTVAVTVNAVNDTPVVNGPGSAYTVNEQTNLSIEGTGFTINDVDAAVGTMTAVITVGEGAVTVDEGDSGVTISSGNGTGTVTITGTLTQIDNLLTAASTGTIVYTNSSDTPSASTTITLTVNDGGNTGTDPGLTADGTSEEDSASQTINITAVNDEEVLATNTGTIVAEGSTGNTITTAMLETTDVDNTNAQLVYTVDAAPTNGTLRLSGTALGLNDTFTQADIDAGNITYDHDGSQISADSFDFTVDDGAGTTTSSTFNWTVTNVNDPPVNTVPGAQSVNEDTLLAIAGISVADADDNLSTVQLTVNDGVLNVTLSGAASISAGANGSSELTLSGSLADINATLASLTYLGNLNFNGSDTLTVLSTDSDAATDSDTVTITVNAVNDTPFVNGPGSVYTVNEQTNLSIEGTGFTVADVDAASGTMTATMAVGEGAITVAEGDSGVTISGGNGTGSVTLTGTLAQIDNLLTGSGTGTIVYNNGSDTPSASTTITLTVNDGGNTGSDPGLTADGTSEEDSASQTINITATNDDPFDNGSLPTDVTVTEDVLTAVGLSSVDFSDVDAGSSDLTVTLSTSTGGQITLAADASIDFGGTATARTLTGTLAELNAYFDNASNIQYLHGTPNTFGNDADTITVVINDSGNTGTGGGTDQNLGTVNVDITAVNDEEVLATNTGTTIAEGSTGNAVTTAMLETTDVDNTTAQLVYTVDAAPTNGTLRLSGTALGLNNTFTQADIDAGNVTYDHDGSQTSADSFDFTVDDGAGTTTSSTFNFTVTNVNDAPVNTVPGAQTVDEDTSINITGISVADDDSNLSTVRLTVNNGTLDVTLSGTAFIFAGANGSSDLTLSGSLADINATLASLTYQGNLHFNGSDTLTVLSTDSNAATDSDTVAVTVSAVNDTPSVTGPGSAYSATEQTNLNIHGTGFGVTDLDATSGLMTATFTVGEGAIVLAAGDSGTSITANNASTVSFTGTLAQINALLAGSSTGTIVYNNGSNTPSAATTITLTVNDRGNTGSDPGLTADGTSEEDSATQTINILAIDDAPTISSVVDQVIDEDTSTGPLAFSVADPENATLTVAASSSDTSLIPNSSIYLTDLGGGNWTVEVVPVANASGGPASIEIAVDDGNAITTTQFAVTVTPIDDAPVVTGGPFAVFENASNGTFIGSMSVSDVDTNDSHTLTITGGSGAAIFAIDNLGQITVSDTSLLDFESSSSHTIEVTATDSSNLSASGLVTIQVIDQNEIPVAVNDNYTTNEGDTLTVDSTGVRTNDTDPEGDSLTVSLVSGPHHGTLTLNPDGSFEYTHDGSETTSDHFQYAVTDSMSNTSTASVVLNIVPVNDAPDGTADTFTASTGELRISATEGVLANDWDIEGGQISSVLVGAPAHGSLSMLSDGSFVYAPDPGFVGTDSFSYAVSDGQTTSSPITVRIEVLGGADPGNSQPTDGTPNTTHPNSSKDERDPVQEGSQTPPTIQSIPTIDVRSGPESEPKATQQSEQGTNSPSYEGPESLLEPEESVYQHTSPRFFAMAKRMDMSIQRLGSDPLRPFLTMGVTKHLLTVLPIENGGQDGSADFQRIAVGTTTAISSALTVGYVIWLIRGGTILASVLSTMPSWIAYDPLPILESFHEEEREDEVSLASLVEAD